MVIFDATTRGTRARDWHAAELLHALPSIDLSVVDRLTVVAAHPDDETLGAGGLLAECSRRGIPISVVVVTDGSASHPRSRTLAPDQLAVLRQRELFLAVSELCPDAEVVMLGFVDGETSAHREAIAIDLARVIPPGSTVVVPWRGDGHRDHRVVGEICVDIATRTGAAVLEYPIWMWHWSQPDDDRVPWASARALPLASASRTAKTRALRHHGSQVAGIGSGEGDGPVLSSGFLANFDRDSEVFFVSNPQPAATKSQQYFDSIYAENPDPWRLGTRWYEERKRAITAASLPHPSYARGLEIGSSIGELTATLATRCDSLLAVDISAAAVAAAADRVAALPGVRVELTDVTLRFPPGIFDLIVLSEVAYYWDRPTLVSVLDEVSRHLAPDGILVACHWRHEVADYPLGGDEVHHILHEGLSLASIVRHDEEDFLLEVFAVDSRSVATREGLVE